MSGDDGGGVYTVVLAKEDFKFSCAHFTLFGAERAELLHGHNYQVSVELAGRDLDRDGLLIDFVRVKTAIRAACARFDSRTLVPAESPHLEIARQGAEIELVFGERRYRLPAADVVLLPAVNTSIEVLARLLWDELATAAAENVERLGVEVSETAGQGCWYRAPVRR